jgi:hypothetical protein
LIKAIRTIPGRHRDVHRAGLAIKLTRSAIMKNWFLYLSGIGIIAVTIASSIYIWQAVDSYQLQRRAKRFCEGQIKDIRDENEKWVAMQGCVNSILGDRKVEDQSGKIPDLEMRLSDLESTLQSEVSALRADIAGARFEAILRRP